MTKKEALRRVKGYLTDYIPADNYKEVEEIVEALKQEPCDDCISRQAVLEIQTKYAEHIGATKFWQMRDDIKELPPVTPQPKTGHWEWVQYDYNPKLGNWHCSECRCVVVECVDKNEKGGIPLYKYCPQCGAKMVEPQAESKEKTCEGCINAKECVMYDPSMKRCKEYKADPKEIYNKGFADGQKALAEHLKLCKEELLNKIRNELKGKYRIVLKDTPKDDWSIKWNECIDEVLEVIDKYREREDKE